MLSIEQSADRAMWTQAAEALASALSVLPRDKQVLIATDMIAHVREAVREASDGEWRAGGSRLPKLPLWEAQELEPWAVHLADAMDDLDAVSTDPPPGAAEFSSKIAAAVWDAVVGLQVAAWAAADGSDFQAWRSGARTRGVFENAAAQQAGAAHWLRLDRCIRAQPEFLGKADADIYKPRPAVDALKTILEAG